MVLRPFEVVEQIEEKDLESEIEKAFNFYVDDDNPGDTINLERLKRVAHHLNETFDTSILEKMIKCADTDDDGEVTLSDFKRIMKKMGLF